MEPASIRYKNPGAMWGRTGPRPSANREVATNNSLAKKWGSAKTFYLSDGTGQGNNIADFPTYVQGICAQLDLWRSSKNYKNRRLADALHTWSGGNHTESYISYICQRVPGMTRDTVLNDAFWQSPNGILFLKAQAAHEAGKKYPAPDADWIEARRRVFAGVVPAKNTARNTTAAVIAASGGAAATLAPDTNWVIGILVVTAIAAIGVFIFWRKRVST